MRCLPRPKRIRKTLRRQAVASVFENLESRLFLSAEPVSAGAGLGGALQQQASNLLQTGTGLTTGTAPADTGAPALITSIYQDLLGRNPDPGGLQDFTTLLQNGASATTVAQAILNSAEYATRLTDAYYTALLHRTADPGGQAAFTTALQAGTSIEQVQAILLGSDEYYATRAQGTNNGFLQALYNDTLGRAPDPGGMAAFMALLSGGTTRQQIAALVLGSGEYQQVLVRSMYRQFVGRDPSAAELTTTLTSLQQQASDQSVLANLLGSNAYFATAIDTYGTTNQKFVTHVYRDLLGQDPDPTSFTSWVSQLNANTLTPRQLVLALESSDAYRQNTVQALYQQLLGRVADPAGLAGFDTALSQGTTDENLTAILAGSDEYYQKQGRTNDAFVQGLYSNLLGRAADAAGLAGFTQVLAAGSARSTVINAILSSAEYQQRVITDLYQKLLGRAPDPAGLAGFATLLANGTTDETVIAALVCSSEYLAKA